MIQLSSKLESIAKNTLPLSPSTSVELLLICNHAKAVTVAGLSIEHPLKTPNYRIHGRPQRNLF
jgi:hypothetical protein